MIFFSNPKITSEKLIKPHYQQTAIRIQKSTSKYVLALQDQMRLNFTGHSAKTELGRIGKTKTQEQYGLIQHSVLCVTENNEPLGLMDVKLFDYQEFNTEIKSINRPIKDKASRYWIDALADMRQRLGECQQRIITVADREGDFFDFLYNLIKGKEEFVIRAKFDRYTGKTHRARGQRLWSVVSESEVKGYMAATIQDVNTREMKDTKLTLKAAEVTLPPSSNSKKSREFKRDYKPIKVNVVMAYNDEHEWVLLTNLPADELEQIKEIVNIYRSRWHIEDYHKVLKTGYQVDEIYLHSSRQAIENLLIMASISACRLYWLIYVGRSEPSIKADRVFAEFEWKAVYAYFNEPIPDKSPPLSVIILKIARLGGYKPTKKGNQPGIKTMWTGFQHFTTASQIYRNMSTKT